MDELGPGVAWAGDAVGVWQTVGMVVAVGIDARKMGVWEFSEVA